MVEVAEFVDRFEGGRSIVTDDKPSSDTRYYVLKVSAVTSGNFNDEAKHAPITYEPPSEHFVRRGDLLFSRLQTRRN